MKKRMRDQERKLNKNFSFLLCIFMSHHDAKTEKILILPTLKNSKLYHSQKKQLIHYVIDIIKFCS